MALHVVKPCISRKVCCNYCITFEILRQNIFGVGSVDLATGHSLCCCNFVVTSPRLTRVGIKDFFQRVHIEILNAEGLSEYKSYSLNFASVCKQKFVKAIFIEKQ
jgi:hypothetical protein